MEFRVYKKKSTIRKEKKLAPPLYLQFKNNQVFGWKDYIKILSLTKYKSGDYDPGDIYFYSEIFSMKRLNRIFYFNFLRISYHYRSRKERKYRTKRVLSLQKIDSLLNIKEKNILLLLYSLKLDKTSLMSKLPLDVLKEIIKYHEKYYLLTFDYCYRGGMSFETDYMDFDGLLKYYDYHF
jgi:hypothetical protein